MTTRENRMGSHAIPCRLTWCRRKACRDAKARIDLRIRTRVPDQVVVNGRVHYACTVCEERIVPSRSELDHDGRCDDCRP